MAILKPISTDQYQVSLESEDRDIVLPSSFMHSSGFELSVVDGGKLISISAPHDPGHFTDLVDYCLEHFYMGPDAQGNLQGKLFTLTHQAFDWDNKPIPGLKFVSTGCRLVKFLFCEADRLSSKSAFITLTFNPGPITRIKG